MKFIPLRLGNPKNVSDSKTGKAQYFSPLSIFSYKLGKTGVVVVTFTNGTSSQIKETEEEFLALFNNL